MFNNNNSNNNNNNNNNNINNNNDDTIYQKWQFEARNTHHAHTRIHMEQGMYKYEQKAEGKSAGESEGLLLKEVSSNTTTSSDSGFRSDKIDLIGF